MYPGDIFYISAFYDLSTCREIGMALGPIPWDKIYIYSHHKGLDEDLIDPFIQIIREMDAGYLNWNKKQQLRKKDGGDL
jgi:hypothetical protein